MQAQSDSSEQVNYDSFLLSKHDSEDAVSDIIETIILNGAKILHKHHLETQINSYSTKTMGIELIMNLTWAKLPLGAEPSYSDTLPDDDLELPKIDSWANGALSVFESMPLRSSCAHEYPVKKKTKKESKANDQIINQNSFNEITEKVENQSKSFHKTLKPARIYSKKTIKSSKQNSEPLTMNRILADTKKLTGKNVTIDSDFNVIEIAEHKNFATSLIIPKVTTKRLQKDEPPTKPLKPKRRIPIQKRESKLQKKPLPKLLQIDNPSFDEDQHATSVAEKIVCSPGVTYKEGNYIKSKPIHANPNELTRSQYQEYLEELKKNSKGDFIE